MATNYPGAIDSHPNPGASTKMDATGFQGDVVVGNLGDSIEAVQAILGTNPQGGAATVKARIAATEVQMVSETVTLDDAGSPIREFYCTGSATIGGVSFAAGTVVVFRRTPADVWGYIVVDTWTNVGATTTTTTADGTTTTTTTAATTTTTTTAATTTTTTTAGTTTTTTTTAPITDSFNRANSAVSLGNTDTGQTWEQVETGIVGISGNAAYRATSNGFAVVDFGQADMHVEHTIAVNGDNFSGCIARYVDNSNFYRLATGSGGGVSMTIRRHRAGTDESVGGSPVAITVGDRIGVSLKEVGGSTEIKLWKNGSVAVTLTDSTSGRPMGTKAGIRPFNNGTIRIEDFEVKAPA